MIKKQLNTKEFFWMAIVFWSATLTAIEAPFSFALKTNIQACQLYADVIISCIFLADLIYHYREGKKYSQKFPIKKNFTYYFMFVVDIVSCIPFDLLANFWGMNEIFSILRLLRLIRIIKVFYLIENITIVPSVFRIFATALFFLTVVDWIACGWILIYPRTEEFDVITYYIRSFYWALTTLSTIGYGDITPKENIGMIYTCFVMLIGVGMYGVVIGNITRIMNLADRYKEQSREKMSGLIQFMKHYEIPMELQDAAIAHYHHLFSKRLSEDDEKIISDLPHALQNEMQIYMKINLIKMLPIFYDSPADCLKDVALKLEQVFTAPQEKIISSGEIGHEMYNRFE
jgi:hypothetical protein